MNLIFTLFIAFSNLSSTSDEILMPEMRIVAQKRDSAWDTALQALKLYKKYTPKEQNNDSQ